jgi:hypothetical protein
VTRLSSKPKWLLTRLAALVTALFLMLMHLAIAAITYLALITVAPVRDGPR